MANYYYGLNRGNQMSQAVVAGASPSKDVEIVVNTAVFTEKSALLLAIRNLEGFIISNVYPPL